MTVISITTEARCKHCKFAQLYRPIKNDGEYSSRSKTKCVNNKSPRFMENINQRDLVCSEWKLI